MASLNASMNFPHSQPFSPRRRELEFLSPRPLGEGEGEGKFSDSSLDSATPQFTCCKFGCCQSKRGLNPAMSKRPLLKPKSEASCGWLALMMGAIARSLDYDSSKSGSVCHDLRGRRNGEPCFGSGTGCLAASGAGCSAVERSLAHGGGWGGDRPGIPASSPSDHPC